MKLIAHRGLWNKEIKDNSYEALLNGLRSNKYIGIECDIRETLDNKIIIYHDPLFKGNLVKNTLAKEFLNICKLENILKIKTNKIILLEIKDFKMNLDNLLKILNKYNQNIYIMSFDKTVIEKIKNKTKKYKLGILNYVLNSDFDYKYDFICLLDAIASSKNINYYKNKNIEVFIYGTINLNRNLTYIVDDYKINDK